MATYLLNISSDDREQGAYSDDFSVAFAPAMRLAGNWQLALVNATMWYSWYNISPDYNNQTIKYYNGSVWKTVIIPAGLYGINDINAYLQSVMLANNDVTI